MEQDDAQRIIPEPTPPEISRRKFISGAVVTAGAAMVQRSASGQEQSLLAPSEENRRMTTGLLKPQQNAFRNVIDLSGIWEFQTDPQETGEADGWTEKLPNPRPIPVPCSWNDLFDDVRNYLDLAWYLKKMWLPLSWRNQRTFIRVESANYAAKLSATHTSSALTGAGRFKSRFGAIGWLWSLWGVRTLLRPFARARQHALMGRVVIECKRFPSSRGLRLIQSDLTSLSNRRNMVSERIKGFAD